MAKPSLGFIIRLEGKAKKPRWIQSRPDTWANKALAKDLDDLLDKTNDEVIVWFDKGGEVISERVKGSK